MMVGKYIKQYHTLSNIEVNTILLKVLLEFYVWYLQSNTINGYC